MGNKGAKQQGCYPAQQQQQQQSNCWSEHSAPNGTKYYYNATTGESTYERPAELGGPEPNKVVASKAAATTMEQSTTHKKSSLERIQRSNQW